MNSGSSASTTYVAVVSRPNPNLPCLEADCPEPRVPGQARCRDHRNEEARRRRANNPAAYRAAVQKWRAAHREEELEKDRARRAADPEKYRKLNKIYRAANLEVRQAKGRQRSRLKTAAVLALTPALPPCPEDGYKHGTPWGYQRGCRGEACVEAMRARDRARYERRGEAMRAEKRACYWADPEKRRRQQKAAHDKRQAALMVMRGELV